MYIVTCPKQGLEMEAVVHRVTFLEYFRPKHDCGVWSLRLDWSHTVSTTKTSLIARPSLLHASFFVLHAIISYIMWLEFPSGYSSNRFTTSPPYLLIELNIRTNMQISDNINYNKQIGSLSLSVSHILELGGYKFILPGGRSPGALRPRDNWTFFFFFF